VYKLFQGMLKTDYQDVLRTIGHYIDEHGFSGIRLIETEDCFFLQCKVGTEGIRGWKKM